MGAFSAENVDFDSVFDEITRRIKSLDESQDWLECRDTWMFVEGVALLMRYESPELKDDFDELCDQPQRKTEETTRKYFKL